MLRLATPGWAGVGPFAATAVSASPALPADGEIATKAATVVDVTVTKTDGVMSVVPGAAGSPDLQYTITITNNETDTSGSKDVTGIEVRDLLGDGDDDGEGTELENLEWQCTENSSGATCSVTTIQTGDIDAGDLTVDLAAVASGDSSVTIQISGDVKASAAGVPCVSGSCLENTVEVELPTGFCDPNGDSVLGATDDDTALDFRADLELTKTSPAEAVPGTDLEYTVTVTNQGPSDARNVILDDPTPTDLVFQSVQSVDVPSCTTLPCALGTIAAGDQVEVTITFSVPADYHLTHDLTSEPNIANTASVTSDTPPDTGSDQRSQMTSTMVVPKADLDVMKINEDPFTSSPVTTPGRRVTYRIEVTSNGPSTVSDLSVTEQIPAIVLSPIFETSAGTFRPSLDASGQFSGEWTGLALATSQTVTLTVTGVIDPAATGMLSNTVIVEPLAPVVDADSVQDSASLSDALTPEADLSVIKGNGASLLGPNQLVQYLITARNVGPSDVTDARVFDDFPADLTGASWTFDAAGAVTLTDSRVDGESETDGDTVNGLEGASGVALGPDSAHVYVAGGADNALAVFGRQSDPFAPGYGELDFLQTVAGLSGASSVAVSPDGGQVYVGAAGAGEVVVYERLADGTLDTTPIDTETGVTGISALVVSPDGRQLYATAATSSTLHVFDRLADGTLAPLETWTNGDLNPGNVGLGGASALALPLDGKNVYVTGRDDDALVVFERGTDGTLTFAQVIRDDSVGGTGNALQGASAVTVSPDGKQVYTTGGDDDSVSFFDRDLSDGSLTFSNDVKTDGGGIDGLQGPAAVVVSPDGKHLFVAGASDKQVAAFSRQASGSLDFVASTGQLGIGSLTGVSALAVTPGGEHLLAVAGVDDSLLAMAISDGASGVGGSGGTLDATVELPAGSSGTFTVDAQVVGSPGGSSISNTATVSSASLDSDPANPHPTGTCADDSNNNSCEDLDLIGLSTDVTVTKSDGTSSAEPGESHSYTVTVSNFGSTVTGLRVTDPMPLFSTDPAGFVDGTVGWQCVAEPGACCTTGSADCGTVASPVTGGLSPTNDHCTGSEEPDPCCTGASTGTCQGLDRLVDLNSGGVVTFTLTGTLDPDARGTLSNTARAELPPGFADPNPGDNAATDDTELTPVADLQITKSSATTQVEPGGQIQYLITVQNQGPSSVAGVTVTDPFPPEIPDVTWTCSATGGASCTTEGSGDIDDTADLPVGGMVTYTAGGTVSASATGILRNTAHASLPGDVTDPSINTAVLDIPLTADADLEIDKSDGLTSAVAGEPITYSIRIFNDNPGFRSDALGARVVDLFPPALRDVSWTCSAEAPIPGFLRYLESHFDGGLGEADGVAISPDGRHVFAVGKGEDALLVYNRQTALGPDFGRLTLFEVERNGESSVTGLERPVDIAVSPDGLHLYVAAEGGAVVVFARALNGVLSFVEEVVHGDLQGPSAVALSADDRHVYVGGAGAIVVFERDSTTGILTYLQTVDDAAPDDELFFDDLESGDGNFSVSGAAGSAPWQLVDDSANSHSPDHAFFVSDEAFVKEQRLEMNGDVEISAAGATLEFWHQFVTEAGFDGGVLEYTTDDGASWHDVLAGDDVDVLGNDARFVVGGYNRSLSFCCLNPLPGRRAWSGTSGGFRQVVVDLTDFEGETVRFRWRFGEDSSISSDGWWVDDVRILVPGGGTFADLVVTPADDGAGGGGHVYAVAVSDLLVFSRDNDTMSAGFGELILQSRWANDCGGESGCQALDPGLAGVRSVAVDGQGVAVYVAGADRDTLVVFSRDATTGSLSDPAVFENGANGVSGMDAPEAVTVSDDGQHVYVASAESNAIAQFRRNTLSGSLVFEGCQGVDDPPCTGGTLVPGLRGPTGVVVSPDGEHVYTTAGRDNALDVFERQQPAPTFPFVEVERDGVDDPEDGGGPVQGLFGPRAVAVSPEGSHVYAAGFGDDAVVAFERSEKNGDLSFVQVHRDGIGGVSGLGGPAAIALSPAPGEQLFVASEEDNAVAIFNRDTATGLLSFETALVDGVGGVDGLAGAAGLALSPQGEHLYVAGQFDAAVAVLERNGGSLQFVEAKSNGAGGVSGLAGAFSLAVSSDGAHVYVASRVDDALVVFARERQPGADFGKLTFLQKIQGFVGLDQAVSVAVAPAETDENNDDLHSQHVYVAGANDGAVAVFRRDADSSSETFGELQFVQTVDTTTVPELAGARSVAVSASAANVYVASEFAHALVVFARDTNQGSADFGKLTLLEVRIDGVGDAEGLEQAYGVAVSPDTRNIYVAALGEDAVSAYQRTAGSFCVEAGTGDIDQVVDVGFGGVLTYTVIATISPDFTGTLSNTASVINAIGTRDPHTQSCTDVGTPSACCTGAGVGTCGNNSSTDANTLVGRRADLRLTKSDGVTSVVAGETTRYGITVFNEGPSSVVGATVTDVFGPDFGLVDWTCEAAPSGRIRFVEAEVNGSNGVTGLDGASGVAVDSGFVYATGLEEDAVVAFRADPVSGELTFLEMERDGVDDPGDSGSTVDGLKGASSLVVVGDHLYVTGQIDDAVAVFTREIDGRLTFVEAEKNGVGGVVGLDQALAIAASGDKAQIYVAGANDDAVVVFDRDPGTGELTNPRAIRDGDSQGPLQVSGLDGASGVAVSSDDAHVYVTGRNAGAVAVFSRDGDGDLTWLETKSLATTPALAGASGVAVNRDGSRVYVTGSSSDALVVFTRHPDGTLTLEQVVENGSGGLRRMEAPKGVVVSPDGFHVYVAAQVGSAVEVLVHDPTQGGALVPLETHGAGPGASSLLGAAALVLSGDGGHLYVAGSSSDAVTVFERLADSSCTPQGSGDIMDEVVDVAAGGAVVYTAVATVAPASLGVACMSPLTSSRNCVANTASVDAGGIDPDTDNNTDTDQNFLVLQADLGITKTDGRAELDGLLGATSLAISPGGGTHLYVAGRADNAVGVFARNPSDGNLTFVESQRDGVNGVDGLSGVSAVAVSADGRHVYTAAADDNALVVFSRDPVTGLLGFVERKVDGIDGVDGLVGARGLALSTDGAHLYAVAAGSEALVVFRRDRDESSEGFGRLTFVEMHENGAGGITDLAAPIAVAVSDDGATVYVAAPGSNALLAFARDRDSNGATFGQLTLLEVYVDGGAAIDGLAGISGVVVTADNAHVYTTGAGENAVTVFARNRTAGDPDLGRLTVEQVLEDGVGGVEDLQTPSEVAVASDGAHVYVTASGSDSVAVFARDTDSGADFGRLTPLQTISEGDPQVDGLAGAAAVVTTSEPAVEGSKHVYVVSAVGHALAGFARDRNSTSASFGELTFVDSWKDGEGGVPPGSDLEYTIVATNHGPTDVSRATLRDVFPAEFTSVSWQCNPLPGSIAATCGQPDGTGDVDLLVDLPAGTGVRVLATATLAPGVVGTISNTATIGEPVGVLDLFQANNSATDDDTILAFVADLEVQKTSGGDGLIPGALATYEITVLNHGPSDAFGISVEDLVPGAFSGVDWTCSALPEPGLLTPSFVLEDDSINVVTGFDGLLGVAGGATSPDGSHLYLTGGEDDAVVVFARDARTGGHVFVEALRDGEIQAVEGGDVTIDGLDGAVGAAVSPNGAHVYVAGELDDAISVFARDAETGSLTFVEFQRDGAGVINGLGGVQALAFSPDGLHLYAAGTADNAIAVFRRNVVTGRLSFVEAKLQGAGGVQGLSGVRALEVSRDGTRVAAVSSSAALAVFSRNPSTGALSLLQTVREGDSQSTGTVDGLEGAAGVALGPDGDTLYAVGEDDDALVVFARDDDPTSSTFGRFLFRQVVHDGDAGPEATVAGLGGARDVVVSPDGGQVYAAGATGAVANFRRDDDGLLTCVDAGAGTCAVPAATGTRSLFLTADGKTLYAASPASHVVHTFARPPGSTCSTTGTGNLFDTADLLAGGTLTYRLTGRVNSGVGAGLVSNTARVTPDDSVLDPGLFPNEATDVDPVTLVSDIVITKEDGAETAVPGDPILYTLTVANDGPSDVFGVMVEDVFPRFPADPAGFLDGSLVWTCAGSDLLALTEVQRDGVAGVDGLAGLQGLAESPDGRDFYVVGEEDDSVALFTRNTETGSLTFVEAVRDGDDQNGTPVVGLDGASSVAVSPDGAHVYVTGDAANSIVSFERDVDTGSLTYLDTLTDADRDGLEGSSHVVVSGDGAFLYVAAKLDGAVTVLARDVSSGLLQFVERKKEAVGEVPAQALAGARRLVLGPDDRHLYVVSQQANAVAVFGRRESDGGLDLLEVVRQGDVQSSSVVEGLSFGRDLVLSPDGAFLYVASLAEDSVATFSRNQDSGSLTFLSILRNGVAGITGLNGATALALSPDAQLLFVAGSNSDAVALFRRDWSSGALTLFELVENGAGGLTLLDSPQALLASADGKALYVAAAATDSVHVFAQSPASSCQTQAGSEDLQTLVDLAAGSSVTFTASGVVDPAARGDLTNVATADLPPGVLDPELPNQALDTNTLTPQVDLAVVKDDEQGSAVAGQAVTYSIEITNDGPSHSLSATVQDDVPEVLANVSWSCEATAGSSCGAPAGLGDLDETIDVLVGGTVTYTLTGTLLSNATGNLDNMATVTAGLDEIDDEIDNVSLDRDVIVGVGNLAVAKTGEQSEAVPGAGVRYTIVVTNLGPSDVGGITVRDILPPELSAISWSCFGSPGVICQTDLTIGNVNDVIRLPANGTATYTVDATLDPAATGTLANTASALPPSPASDPEPGNNESTDTEPMVPHADDGVSVTADVAAANPGDPVTFTIVVTNSGPSDDPAALVGDVFPPEIENVTWTCAVAGGADCSPSGAGDIAEFAFLPAGGTVTFTATGTVVDVDPGDLPLFANNVATVMAGVEDPLRRNDSAAVRVVFGDGAIFTDGFESGDVSAWSFLQPTEGP